ncbi:MAG: DUF2891 domain-containing protein [Bacteroidota bacterium]
MKTAFLFLLFCLFLAACAPEGSDSPATRENSAAADEIVPITPPAKTAQVIRLDLAEANRLAELPLACIQNPLPYKSGVVIAKPEDLALPIEHHPAFYGCFDWHSAVHGHWSLVYLLKTFPELARREDVIRMLGENLTAENIAQEVAYFSMNRESKSFERTYGWAWLLKLQEEFVTWDDVQAQTWASHLQPLADYISRAYREYLPKLVYPIRVGEHSNTAFGLSFAFDYAVAVGDSALEKVIRESARRFYQDDAGCPIDWEPSGYDFLSPCLQEIDIMRKVLEPAAFVEWLADFLPALHRQTLALTPGEIRDRSDGKLVHLDGLNFSRAWCLFPLRNNANAYNLAVGHLDHSLSRIADGDYAGQHWLASFALYAFKCQRELDE